MRVPHITRAVFLSQDGLALGASRGMDQADVEHLAALAAAFQSLARSASHTFGGEARQSIIEMAYEMAILVQRTGDHLQVNMRTRSAL
jgi:predicted regulator of Ras-like GTPase activity (Roadblock/LC7/MglB family)